MAYGSAQGKARRLVEIQREFWVNPGKSLTAGEIADRTDIPVRSVRKYLNELRESDLLPIVRENGCWRLKDRTSMRALPVGFEMEEAVAVYLAARLLTRHVGGTGPAVRGAVRKMAAAVPEELRDACDRLAGRVPDARERAAGSVFKTIVRGWVLNKVVAVTYLARNREKSKPMSFQPYLIEPSALGSAVYVIGWSNPPGEVRVMKLARIRTARMLPESFVPPSKDEILERLDRAWAVWITDDDPQEVHLRFDASIASRVRETRWHPSQRLVDAPDGSLDMFLSIVSTIEIVNWVLGWGPLCEVVAPEDLRTRIADEHRRAAALYE